MYAVLYDNKSSHCSTVSKEKTFLIGRSSDADLKFLYPGVERLHSKIKFKQHHWTITNLGKITKTLLNGILIESKQLLKSKDIITIGNNIELVFFESSYEIPSDVLTSNGIAENYKRIIYENHVLCNEVIQSRKRIRNISLERDSFEREASRLRQEKKVDKNTIKELKENLVGTAGELDNAIKDYNKAIELKNNAISVANLAVLKAMEIDILKKNLSEATALAKKHESEKNIYLNMLENRIAIGTNGTEIISNVLDQELSCCVCNEVVYKAIGLGCGHSLCKYCLQKWKQQKRECPLCRMPIKAEVPCLSLDSFIETFAPFLGTAFNAHREEFKNERHADEAKMAPTVIRRRGGRAGDRRNLSLQGSFQINGRERRGRR